MKQIVKVIFGSRLYGTNTPNSDTDYKSIHLPDSTSILLQKARDVISTGTKHDTTIKNRADDVDNESFALHKFMNMLKVGDMVATEMLFIPKSHIIEQDYDWEYFQIPSVRDRLLNKQIKGFLGYCIKQSAKYGVKGDRVACVRAALDLIRVSSSFRKVMELEYDIEQFVKKHEFSSIVEIDQPHGDKLKHWEVCGRKIPFTIILKEATNILQITLDNYGERALQAEANEGVDWKAVSHAVRVGEQAEELCKTGFITFPRPNATDLLSIKNGEVPYVEVAERLENQLELVKLAAESSTLPDKPNIDFMDAVVADLYAGVVCDEYE